MSHSLPTPDAEYPQATVGMGKGGAYEWFDPEAEIDEEAGQRLPHWRQPGCIYFVTFRTDDSIPADVLAQWQEERAAWMARHPEPHDAVTAREYHRQFTARTHRYLDAGHGNCPFRLPSARRIVVEILRKLDGAEDGYALDAFVVMPNHVHVLVAPQGSAGLSEIGQVWKRVSAHRVNKLLGQRGTLWQHESWDHIVRSPEHLERYRRYIWDNPKWHQRRSG